jgi:hypothetical protein
MHDGSTPARITVGDTWIRDNLDAYYQWARTNNSLLIITADEDAFNLNNNLNRIPTIFAGAHVRPNSSVSQSLTLHDILRTLEETYGTAHSASAANVRTITGPFTTDPTTSAVSFRNGLSGYNGARDTQLRQDQPNTAFAALEKISVSRDDNAAGGNQPTQMLIRFDDVIGANADQVPAGATITSGKLTLWTNSASGSGGTAPVALHRMLGDWSETSTWNTLAAGVSSDDVEAAVAADFSHHFTTLAHPQFFDVSNTLQAYADGAAPNFGWAVLATSTDGYSFNSSDALTPLAQRPSLEITYALLPRWKSIAPGSWADAGNWSFGLPDGIGATARVSLESPLDIPFVSIALDGNRTVGNLAFAASTSYHLSPGALGDVLHINNGGIAPAHLHITTGHHVIEATAQFDDHARVETAPATSLTFTGGVAVAAGKTLAKNGAGDLHFSDAPLTLTATSTLDLIAGQTILSANSALLGGARLALRRGASLILSGPADVSALSIHGTPGNWQSTIDLDHSFLIHRATAETKNALHADIQALIKSGQNGQDANLITNWNGPGITSSSARPTNVAANFDLVALGVIRNSDIDIATGFPGSAYTTFNGIPVTVDDILVKFTYTGDGNLDGAVTFDDYAAMDAAFFGTIANLGWATGDINFDNVINFDDYAVVDQAFFNQGAPLSGEGSAVAAVPEPATWLFALAALSFGACVLRRLRLAEGARRNKTKSPRRPMPRSGGLPPK